jgi:hypothetical protein
LYADRSGPARRERGDWLAAHAIKGVRHETGSLFVVRRNGLDSILPVKRRVHQADIAVAAQAEKIRHTPLNQMVDYDFGAFLVLHRYSPLLRLHLRSKIEGGAAAGVAQRLAAPAAIPLIGQAC